MKYVNLVIDNKSDSTDSLYTYGCEDDRVEVGSKVYVPFSKSQRLREGYVVTVSDFIDDDMRNKLRYVESISDDIYLSEEMISTAVWLKKRYICRYIDAVKCFVPAGKKSARGHRKDPFEGRSGEETSPKELTYQQRKVLDAIDDAISKGKHERFLVHGVTGSGKTEIYMRAAEKVIRSGKKVVILVPEISLTTQIIDRFIGRFGNDTIAVLHSRLSPGERYDQWKKIRNGSVDIVIGARSAVFAPFENIGLIVMDEEHEATYKSDNTPKYDTVEVAIKRLKDPHNSGVLILGSATPSIVTYSRGNEGIYHILKLTERYNKTEMPSVSIVDMRKELKAGNRSVISRELYCSMKEQLDAGRQVMLFLNRRGYSTFISCRECGYVAKCPNCGLSLTYHRYRNMAICHYCGYSREPDRKCPECGSRYIRYFGSGTEKVEENISEIFPDFTVDRIDLDSVKKKGEMERKIRAFASGRADILIGTQLIAKGLDFKNVGLVGIISADVALNIPDFRSSERTFQLITQAAGRAGRGDEKGQVVIQTYNPDHYAVTCAAEQDYEDFYRLEIQMRKYMTYPPYSDLFQVIFTSDDQESAMLGAESWYVRIKNSVKQEDLEYIFAPQEAYLSKVKDIYRYSMLIKCPRGKRREYSDIIEKIKDEDRKNRKKKYTAVVDINPYSFV